MNNLENRIRAAFHADAETIRSESLRPLGSRPALRPGRAVSWLSSRPATGWPARPHRPTTVRPHRKVLIPLAAAASVAVITIAAAVVGPRILSHHQTSGPTTQTTLTAAYPGGRLPIGEPPRFYLGIASANRRDAPYATVLTVFNSATGQPLLQLNDLGPNSYIQAVANVGNDLTFLAATTPGRFPKTARGCDTNLLVLRLNPAGTSVTSSALSGPIPGFISNSALAASDGGKVISYAARSCGTNMGRLTVRHANGTTSTWTYRFPINPTSLSLSADGSLLELVSNPNSKCSCVSPSANAAWTLRTSSASGPLSQRWRKVLGAPNGVDSAALSPTGAVTFAVVAVTTHLSHLSIGAYATATGRLIRVVRVFTKVQVAPTGISTNATGHYALIYMLTTRGVQRLNLITGHVKVLPVTQSDFPIDTAW